MLVFSTTTTSYNEMDFGAFLSLALEARILSVPRKTADDTYSVSVYTQYSN